jgi:hypothetical protein
MVEERADPLVAPLANGKVLVIGGVGFGGCEVADIVSAELYDSNTNRFIALDTPIPGDGYGTATLLSDGTVLLTGAWTIDAAHPMGFRSSALFDPATDTFTLIGGAVQPSAGAAIALLHDGTVLFAGGFVEPPQMVYTAKSTAVVYRPSQRDFVALSESMTATRALASATVLSDGRVLTAGGVTDDSANCPSGCLSSAEVYDPATGRFTTTGNMTGARGHHSATLLPGDKVLLAGGLGGGSGNSAEVWADGSFSATAGPMTHPRYDPIAVMLPNGRVLVVGDGTADLYQP